MGRTDFGGSSKKRRASGRTNVQKRTTHTPKAPQRCKLCERDLSIDLVARDVGRVLPCGCHFCFTGGIDGCLGVFNVLTSAVVHGHVERATQCPGCWKPAERLQRVGPLGVVKDEDVTLPIQYSASDIANMRREHPSLWGTDRVQVSPPQMPADEERRRAAQQRKEAREAVEDEERMFRSHMFLALTDAGLVDLLREDASCQQLNSLLQSQHGHERGGARRAVSSSPKWFTSAQLCDLSQRVGGTAGLLAGRFQPVALCCGAAELGGKEWSAAERAEAVSYVRNRLVDSRVWPEHMRGRLMRADVD